MSAPVTLGLGLASLVMIGLAAIVKPPPLFVWNASASAPIGLYRVAPIAELSIGDLIVLRPPDVIERLLVSRGYIHGSVPLIKRVAALAGQRVCRHALRVSIDGAPAGYARVQDHAGRPLPVWQGCRLLRRGEIFFMTTGQPDSFDGRYFGPLPRVRVIGRAIPIWTRAEGASIARRGVP